METTIPGQEYPCGSYTPIKTMLPYFTMGYWPNREPPRFISIPVLEIVGIKSMTTGWNQLLRAGRKPYKWKAMN